MAKHELVSADEPASVAVPAREPMKELKKWPTACQADQSCEIDHITYPAPAKLDASDVLWWIDVVEMRVNASRRLFDGTTGAIFGGIVGSAATVTGGAVSGSPWGGVGAGALTVVAFLVATPFLLKDSDHAPLEQRLLLYRQRARDLGVLS